MAIVQRPADITPGSTAGDARAAVVTGLSLRAAVGAIATQVFRAATGRQMRRSPDGGITIKSAVAVFG